MVIDCAGLPFIVNEFIDHAKTLSPLIIIGVTGKTWRSAPTESGQGTDPSRAPWGYTPEDILTAIRTLDDPSCRLGEIITRFTHTASQSGPLTAGLRRRKLHQGCH